jgi:hypothetical protein
MSDAEVRRTRLRNMKTSERRMLLGRKLRQGRWRQFKRRKMGSRLSTSRQTLWCVERIQGRPHPWVLDSCSRHVVRWFLVLPLRL